MLVLRLLVMVLTIICLMDGHAEVSSSTTGIRDRRESPAVNTNNSEVETLDRKKKKKPKPGKKKKPKPGKKKKPKKEKPTPTKPVTPTPTVSTSTLKTTTILTTPTVTTTVTTTTTTVSPTTTATTAKTTTSTASATTTLSTTTSATTTTVVTSSTASTTTTTIPTTATTSSLPTTAATTADSGAGGECKATNGKPCIFPFKDGKEYNECKNEGGKYFWCATSIYDSGKYKHWSYCSTNGPCPLEGDGECRATNNKPCVFPFKDGNKEYNECADHGGKYFWCATGTNSAGKYTAWSECPKDGSCPLPQKSTTPAMTSTATSAASTTPLTTGTTAATDQMEEKVLDTLENLVLGESRDDSLQMAHMLDKKLDTIIKDLEGETSKTELSNNYDMAPESGKLNLTIKRVEDDSVRDGTELGEGLMFVLSTVDSMKSVSRVSGDCCQDCTSKYPDTELAEYWDTVKACFCYKKLKNPDVEPKTRPSSKFTTKNCGTGRVCLSKSRLYEGGNEKPNGGCPPMYTYVPAWNHVDIMITDTYLMEKGTNIDVCVTLCGDNCYGFSWEWCSEEKKMICRVLRPKTGAQHPLFVTYLSRSMDFCKKGEEGNEGAPNLSAQCPHGFTSLPGYPLNEDVVRLGTLTKIPTLIACKQLCQNPLLLCEAFIYAPENEKCELISEIRSTSFSPSQAYTIFCKTSDVSCTSCSCAIQTRSNARFYAYEITNSWNLIYDNELKIPTSSVFHIRDVDPDGTFPQRHKKFVSNMATAGMPIDAENSCTLLPEHESYKLENQKDVDECLKQPKDRGHLLAASIIKNFITESTIKNSNELVNDLPYLIVNVFPQQRICNQNAKKGWRKEEIEIFNSAKQWKGRTATTQDNGFVLAHAVIPGNEYISTEHRTEVPSDELQVKINIPAFIFISYCEYTQPSKPKVYKKVVHYWITNPDGYTANGDSKERDVCEVTKCDSSKADPWLCLKKLDHYSIQGFNGLNVKMTIDKITAKPFLSEFGCIESFQEDLGNVNFQTGTLPDDYAPPAKVPRPE